MKAFFKKLARVKKRQIAKKAIGLGAAPWAFKFSAMNSDPPSICVDSGQYTQRLEAQYSYKKTETVDDEQSLTESQLVNSIRFKTDSGAVVDIRNQQSQKNGETPIKINVSSVQPSEALKSALEVRSGDLGKGGPGPRAKTDAKTNASRKGSILLPGAHGYVPHNTYCHYHRNQSLSCKPIGKVSDNPFQDDGNNNNLPPEDGQFDASQ
jgi:hypothetical protein